MPTPVKYKNDALRTACKAVEHESARVMASLQPGRITGRDPGLADRQRAERRRAQNLKAADRLSAVIKCIEEDRGGNREFEAAYAQQMAALHAMHSPEAEYFIEAHAALLRAESGRIDEGTVLKRHGRGRTGPARGIPVIALLREGCGPGMPGPYVIATYTPPRSAYPIAEVLEHRAVAAQGGSAVQALHIVHGLAAGLGHGGPLALSSHIS